GGLPGTGKTTLARLLAAHIGAVHLRVDTIEQAIVRSGLARHPVGPAGYTVGYALAEEHLQQGLTVIAESVNPLA
ncbi:AAA family ATPase, partial [Streptomyces sp. SID8455]|nr:AAA family ATPase [Streptomyces sp. SID8455]